MKGKKPTAQKAAQPLATLPRAPVWMGKIAIAEWKRVGPELIARRTLDRAALGTFESYCVATEQLRLAEAAIREHGLLIAGPRGTLVRNPASTALTQAQATTTRIAAELGLTPASRSKTPAPAAGNDLLDDFDELL